MKLPPRVREALEATGKSWEASAGSKHVKLRVEGKLVGILPLNGKYADTGRGTANIVAQIRRATRG